MTQQLPGSVTSQIIFQLDDLLKFMVDKKASDLHLKPMRPPLVRLNGKLIPLKTDPIKPEDLDTLLRGILSPRQQGVLDEALCTEFGYSVPGVSRFRGTVFYQRGTLAAVFRRVPFVFPSLDDWGLPEILKELADLKQGLVILTGPTGSGKSSTLAAILKEILEHRLIHLVTIEDPIEFLLKDAKGAVTQREVGSDTTSFADALRNSLRQDPDVIMVGENRDLATMSTTLTAAETGHLVLTTLHTNSAAQTIDRIIDMFPADQHKQVRQQLSLVLKAVISMNLVERKDGKGLVAAVEILRESPRISKLIKEGAISEIEEEIEKSVSYFSMQSRNQSLAALVINKTIDRKVAMENSLNPGELDLMLRKFFYGAKAASVVPGEEVDMASDSDYSRVHKLLEIEKLYDDLHARHDSDIQEREARIKELRQQLDAISEQANEREQLARQFGEERERLTRAIEAQRIEYEGKIERLQARIRELTTQDGQPAGRGGLFRR